MALNFILLCLASAAIIQTWLVGTLFISLRKKIFLLTNYNNYLIKCVSKGLLCHFCISCWIGIGISIYYQSLIGIATILPVNIILFLFTLITQKLANFVDIELERKLRLLNNRENDISKH